MDEVREEISTAGWVYILSHWQWVNLLNDGKASLKIGKTVRHPVQRGAQIGNAAGLLGNPTVEWAYYVRDRHAIEREVHERLAQFRVHHRRELFNVSVEHASEVIRAVATDLAPYDDVHEPAYAPEPAYTPTGLTVADFQAPPPVRTRWPTSYSKPEVQTHKQAENRRVNIFSTLLCVAFAVIAAGIVLIH